MKGLAIKPFYCTAVFLAGCAILLHSCAQKTFLVSNPSLSLRVIGGSREVVLRQEKPWEEQTLAYFNVLAPAPGKWQMWYSSWDNRRNDDYAGYLPYACSANGRDWVKQIPGRKDNILFGSGPPAKDGRVEQCVFIDNASVSRYKMIYTAKDAADLKEKTFYTVSADGLNWEPGKVLWNQKFDSQFSVIIEGNNYHIFMRMWDTVGGVRYRAIGEATVSNTWQTTKAPKLLFSAGVNSEFPHLYNNACSKITNSLYVLFPTYFNEKTDSIDVRLAFIRDGQGHLTDTSLKEALYGGEHVKWGCVSPGLIPAGRNIYWLYYYGVNNSHNHFMDKGHQARYYRVKIEIKAGR